MPYCVTRFCLSLCTPFKKVQYIQIVQKSWHTDAQLVEIPTPPQRFLKVYNRKSAANKHSLHTMHTVFFCGLFLSAAFTMRTVYALFSNMYVCFLHLIYWVGVVCKGSVTGDVILKANMQARGGRRRWGRTQERLDLKG